jgi:predicted dehydrogenase
MGTKHIGIVGAGNISETHLRAASQIEGLRIAAVCGKNAEKARALAGTAGVPAYTDLDSFLNHHPIDLIAIGSPSGCHAEQGIAAARKGIHVLVEKPIDVTVRRADLLIKECERAGVKLGVFFQDRVTPDIRRLKQMIESELLGRIHLATAHVKWFRPPEYYSDSRWRGTWVLDGGGAVMNQGVHTVDLLLWLLGDVRSVYARTGTLLHEIETEDTAVATLEFRSGALATFEATTSAFPGLPRRLYVSGRNGTAVLEHDRLVSVDLHGRNEESAQIDSARNLSESSPVVSDVSGHRMIIEDFLDAIQRNRRPLCDGIEGKRSVELVQAIYESSRSGKPVFFT